MDIEVDTAASGVFTRSDVLALGHDDKTIKRALRRGEWWRVRYGAYVAAPLWADADHRSRHLMRIEAVHRSIGTKVAFSHISAVVLHGIDIWAAPLDRVHVIRTDGGASRIERDLVHHRGRVSDADLVEVGGVVSVAPVRAVLDMCATVSTEAALVVADSALHQGLFTAEELTSSHDRLSVHPGLRRAHIVTRLADGLAASPGETRVRYLCFRKGLPKPVLQYEVRDGSGALIGIADFAWPEHGLIAEFDGKVKYGALLAPGQSPTDVVVAEKRREDRIREVTGFRVVRISWADLERPNQLAARLEAGLKRIA